MSVERSLLAIGPFRYVGSRRSRGIIDRMKPAMSIRAVGALLVSSVLLASCSLINGPWRQDKKAPEPPPAPAAPALPMAVATHKFELTPDQDVVGTLQVTHSTKEDTLTDVARRFNV